MLHVVLGLSLIVGLTSLACWIYTVVVAFQKDTAIIGVVCLCPLVALIMGFVKMKEWGHEKVMIVWGICFVINILLNIAVAAIGAPAG